MLIRKSIKLETLGAIAVIRIHPPDNSTSQSPAPTEQLQDACQCLNEHPNLRVVILTNSGDNFWPHNPNSFPHDDPESTLQHLRIASHVAQLNVPTIAAIRGNAWNQGLELALACDLRLAAEDANFGFSCVRDGFIPWDGGTQRLPRIVGRAHALDLLLTGRSLTAAEALKIGLINALFPEKDLHSDAIKLAKTIAQAAPVATRYLKEAIHQGLDLSLPQGLNLEADLSFILQTTQDRKRGIRSFFDNTTPRFTGQ